MKHDFLIELTQDPNNSLSHHGILGQKWGIRRFQNPDGSLTEAGRKRYSEIHDGPLLEKKNDFHSNVDKWGKDANHNLLAVTGISGSGKSTTAYSIKSQMPNVDVISMDFYWDNPADVQYQSKEFNKYLDKNVPEFQKIVKNFEKYDETRFSEENHKERIEYWEIMDHVRDAIFDYAKDCYGSKRVIAEGVQWLDSSLYSPNEKQSVYKDLPIIMKGTNLYQSSLGAAVRDGETIIHGKRLIDYLDTRVKANKQWLKYQKDVERMLSK